MTFNEGMQIDTSTASSSGGGPGGRGLAIGGGVGGWWSWSSRCCSAWTRAASACAAARSATGSGGFACSQCKTGADANNILGCRIIATGNSVDAVWSELLRPGYTRPEVHLFSRVGTNRAAAGPPPRSARSTALPTRPRTSTPTSFTCSSTNSVPAEAPSRRSTSWPTNTATTCRTCSETSAAPNGRALLRGNRAPVCARSCRPTATREIWAHYASTVKQKDGTPYLNPLTERDIKTHYPLRRPSAMTGSRSSRPDG